MRLWARPTQQATEIERLKAAYAAERAQLAKKVATLSVAPPAQTLARAPAPVQVQPAARPALPTPALAERLQESFKALEDDWVKHQGGTLKEINAERADCYGAVAQLDDLHTVQRVGKSIYSIHLLDQLDKVPALNDPKTEIKYRNGTGQVVGSLGPSMGR